MRTENIKNNQSRSINAYRTIALSFILLTIIFLGIVFYFYLNKLTIILTPNKERISDDFIIDIYDKTKNQEQVFSQQAISGTIQQFEVEEQAAYPSSGAKNIGEEIAGQVTIVNNYTKNQPLVASTRLLTADNKLFRIKETINVPANQSIVVDIYTDEPSQEMAIEPTKFTIPGLWAGLQNKIYAESNKKFVYQSKIKKYIQQIDIDQAVSDLKKKLAAKATEKISKDFKDNYQILYDIDQNTTNVNVEGKVNEEKDEFLVTIKAKVAIIIFSDDQIKKVAEEKLIDILPDNKELVEFYPHQIIYTLNAYDVQQGLAEVKVSCEGKISMQKNIDIIDLNKIQGLNEQQLKVYLDNLNEFTDYELIFSPSFRKKAPNLIDRIQVEIKSP
ncbi:MAG: hypothetical protein V1768_00360 [Patescibacteria group bacterium]|nr:hypothetical protein [Patescibacteria group bacterium]MBU1349699.1 hypothetical protein [Patescibacteria group bacterium]MBU1421537.1 hypothetical protein [Patescibacteria group bacterium]MBU1684478.1 hypothetical protein [Patescibacteria group bacterium]MBU1778355.1 hypothetical protein [Patescibacteria group bacterium]